MRLLLLKGGQREKNYSNRHMLDSEQVGREWVHRSRRYAELRRSHRYIIKACCSQELLRLHGGRKTTNLVINLNKSKERHGCNANSSKHVKYVIFWAIFVCFWFLRLTLSLLFYFYFWYRVIFVFIVFLFAASFFSIFFPSSQDHFYQKILIVDIV